MRSKGYLRSASVLVRTVRCHIYRLSQHFFPFAFTFALTMSLLSTPIIGRSAGGVPEVDSSGDEYYTNDDDNRSISSDNDRDDHSGWRPAFGEPSPPRRPIAGGSRRGTNRQLSGPPPRRASEPLDGLCVVSPRVLAYPRRLRTVGRFAKRSLRIGTVRKHIRLVGSGVLKS